MIATAPDTTFTARIKLAPSAAPTVAIYDEDGFPVYGPTTVGVVEHDGIYHVELDAPDAGEYTLIWDDGDEYPEALAVLPDWERALCSLSDVNRFRQIGQGDTQDQARIAVDLILSASSAIESYARTTFVPSTGKKRFFYDGSGVHDLGRHALRSASLVQIAGSPVTDYSLRPLPLDGAYRWLTLPKTSGELSITGEWGYDPMPTDVRHACVATVSYWLARDVSAFSRVWAADVGTVESGDTLPSGVRGLLADYRKPVLAWG